MGRIIKTNDHFEYKQNDGHTTAWYLHDREIKELAHRGSSHYRKVFYCLIGIGTLYLGLVFGLVR